MYSGISKIVSLFRDYNSFNMTPECERDTLIDLEFISRINVGQKINVRFRFFQNDGFATSLSRTFWNVDNKDNTLSFCDNTIKKSFNILKLCEADIIKYDSSSDDYQKSITKIKNLLKLLCKTTIGLQNLQTTYAGFDRFIAQISLIISEINTEIEHRLPKYFDDEEINKEINRDTNRASSSCENNRSMSFDERSRVQDDCDISKETSENKKKKK